MGILDSFKKVFGDKQDPAGDVTVSPSKVLRDAGIDTSRLKLGFGSDGSISASGQITDESDRQKILDILSATPGINRVDDQMSVAPPPQAEEEAPAPAAEAAAEGEGEGEKTYTVESGDTLWKISEKVYGNGSKYMTIFDANTGLLEHPDRIFPGQKLIIPELTD